MVKIVKVPKLAGKVSREAVVKITRAKATITDSAIIGPAGNGVTIADASDVEMSNTLVAAVWGTGVAVEGEGDGRTASRLQMSHCVVRNCYHRCITLGPGCDGSVIERSWISGSAWHGIRYDHASPRIERNIIFDNARSGIYASGKTAASVKRNVFMSNAMGGMSCWHANSDTIEGNIFVGNRERESLAAVGGAAPRVTGNWFLEAGTAVWCGKIAGDDAADGLRGCHPWRETCFRTSTP